MPKVPQQTRGRALVSGLLLLPCAHPCPHLSQARRCSVPGVRRARVPGPCRAPRPPCRCRTPSGMPGGLCRGSSDVSRTSVASLWRGSGGPLSLLGGPGLTWEPQKLGGLETPAGQRERLVRLSSGLGWGWWPPGLCQGSGELSFTEGLGSREGPVRGWGSMRE